MAFTLPAPAMPYTSVPKISGAMIDLIRRRKMLLTGDSCARHLRRAQAQRDARGHADEDPGGERQPLQRSPHLSLSRSTSKKRILGGRIRLQHVRRMLRQTTRSPFAQRLAHLPVDGEVGVIVVGAAHQLITLVSGTITGRLVSMCGQIGVMHERADAAET